MCDGGKPIWPGMGGWVFCLFLCPKRSEEKLTKAIKRYEYILSIALCVFLIVYPFIMGFHVEELSGIAETYFAKKSGYMIDIFQYCKEVTLIIAAVVLLVLLALGLVLSFISEERIPDQYRIDRPVIYLLGGFLILHILSCIFSVWPEYAIFGLSLDYEGMAAIAGYAALFIGGYILLGNEKGIRLILISVRILAVLLIAGTCLECAAGPFFNIDAVARALTPDNYEHLLENVYLDYQGSVSLTFANPGYFGGFCAMLLPVLYGTAASGTRKLLCVFDGLLSGGLFFCVIMSGSSGAMYSVLIVALAETVFLIRRSGLKKCFAAMLIMAASCVLLVLLMSGTRVMSEEKAGDRLSGAMTNSQYTTAQVRFPVDRITLENGELTIESGEQELHAGMTGDTEADTADRLQFTDENGAVNSGELTVDGFRLEGRYSGVTVTVLDQTLSLDLGYQDPLEFYCGEGKLRYIDFNGTFLDSIPQPQIKGMEPLYPLFTGRGYVWISSLPLAASCFFLGKGVGTFPFYFPQSEVAGMLNTHGSADYCIEIAHSWYLQTVVNGGVIALACMAALFLLHLFRGGRKYWTNGMNEGGALFFGLISYQISGIVNNSCVASSAGFWLLFGVGMALVSARKAL